MPTHNIVRRRFLCQEHDQQNIRTRLCTTSSINTRDMSNSQTKILSCMHPYGEGRLFADAYPLNTHQALCVICDAEMRS